MSEKELEEKRKCWREGPVKLCPVCCRFMPIDNERRLLPHNKFLSQEKCFDEVNQSSLRL